jgi:CubicO group peptidase (beta-lactamase class C family)
MNFNKRHLTIIVFFTVTGLSNPRQAPAGEDIPSKIDEYVRAYVENNWFSGATLVAKDGKVLVEKGYGKADNENNIPNGPKTKFRIGSLTKAFTAMAVMQLSRTA